MDLSPPKRDGEVHGAYDNPRSEVTPLIPPPARRVLDVGCSTGAMGADLAKRGHEVTGIEYDPELAAIARTRLTNVIEGDVEAMAAAKEDPGGPFDCIVFADVLEHLRDPWAVVRWGAGVLDRQGTMVISVPNIRHVATFWALLVRRRWPYEEVGIFDRTHLRFFAIRNIPGLLSDTGLEVTEIRRSYWLDPNRSERFNRWARYFGDFGAMQFIFAARWPGSG